MAHQVLIRIISQLCWFPGIIGISYFKDHDCSLLTIVDGLCISIDGTNGVPFVYVMLSNKAAAFVIPVLSCDSYPLTNGQE